MKVGTATIERSDNLDKPHTPCPDVHPEPRLAPRPTITPPITIMIGLTGTSIAGIVPVATKIKPGAKTIPKIRTRRQERSSLFSKKIAPDIIPVAPKIRPNPNIKSTAANPIDSPPPKDINGVKVVSMN